MQIISLVGFADAGKSTAANILTQHGFVSMSYADSIKDCLSAIFGWDRDLLEGITPESRIFRETVDQWWAKNLGIPNFTPRFAMKNFGTDVMRNHFHKDIWVLNVQYRLHKMGNEKVVFGDVRHLNEITMSSDLGGLLIRIRRGDDPIWFETAKLANAGNVDAKRLMTDVYQIHETEMQWIGTDFDYVVENNGSVDDLSSKILAIKQIWI